MPAPASLVDEALQAGAVHTAVAFAVDDLITAAAGVRTGSMARLLSIIEGGSDLLAKPARRRISSSLTDLAPRGDEEREYLDRIRELINAPAAAVAPGQVLVLFKAGAGFGVARQLATRVTAYGAGIKLLHREDDEPSLYDGFWSGTAAALDWVARQLCRAEPTFAERLVYNRQVSGSIQQANVPVRGESLGLGAAISTISAVVGQSVSDTDAFTGRMDLSGRLLSVGGVAEKVRAARDAGATRIFVPADSLGLVPPDGVEIRPCASLDEVVVHVFHGSALKLAFERLAMAPPVSASARDWRTTPDSRPRLLFSMVGKSDPIGTYKDRNGRSLAQSDDGPLLGACRELRPRRVIAFFTVAGEGNDFSHSAQRAKEFIESQLPDCKVTLWPLAETVDDPTDFEMLWDAMSSAVATVRHENGSDLIIDYNCFVNMTSGTGQMQFLWAILAMHHLLPATLLQVRESRRVKTGESRIRRVVLPSGPGGPKA